jgi:hypothetical protein
MHWQTGVFCRSLAVSEYFLRGFKEFVKSL